MAQARIPVDLFNPGQVFACLGFLEAADALIGDAQGGFDWSDESDVRFVLRTAGTRNPVEVVLAFLARASVVALSPKGSGQADRWGVATHIDEDFVFSVSPTVREGKKRISIKESALPIQLSADDENLISVSHWADVDNGRRSLKMWGGAQGKSGASRMHDLLEATRPLIEANPVAASADPFGVASAIGGFRLDMHRDYVPIDIGFSLNAHKGKIEAMGNRRRHWTGACPTGGDRQAGLSLRRMARNARSRIGSPDTWVRTDGMRRSHLPGATGRTERVRQIHSQRN